MTRLKQRIAGLIAATGPIPVSEYMALCLFDPDDGYYTTREPFGASGDFVTAPEISQMFGELVASGFTRHGRMPAGRSPRPLPRSVRPWHADEGHVAHLVADRS